MTNIPFIIAPTVGNQCLTANVMRNSHISNKKQKLKVEIPHLVYLIKLAAMEIAQTDRITIDFELLDLSNVLFRVYKNTIRADKKIANLSLMPAQWQCIFELMHQDFDVDAYSEGNLLGLYQQIHQILI